MRAAVWSVQSRQEPAICIRRTRKKKRRRKKRRRIVSALYDPAKLNNFEARRQQENLGNSETSGNIPPVCQLETQADAVSHDTTAQNTPLPPPPPFSSPPLPSLPAVFHPGKQERRRFNCGMKYSWRRRKQQSSGSSRGGPVYLSACRLHRRDLGSRRGVQGCSFATVPCS